jgi:glycosyltransferase involved in cell wall biosynthesis
MRVALLLVDTSNVGPVVFTKNLIEGLLAKKLSVDLYYFRDGLNKVDLNGVNCKKISLADFKKINSDYYDVVHTTGAIPDLFGMLIVKRDRWVVGVHNFYDIDLALLRGSLLGGVYSFIWSLAFKLGKNFIYSSEEMLNYYEAKFGKKNGIVIPYGIPEQTVELSGMKPADLKLLTKLNEKYKIIGSIGLLIKRKGFEQLIHVLSINLNVCLVLIGDGPEFDNLRKLSIELGVSDRLYLLGYKKNTLPYYCFFDVYVTSSYSEGFGIAMLEAFRQGIPVVCSDLLIYKKYFPTEMLFSVSDHVDLSAKISLSLREPTQGGKKSRAIFEKYFNLEAMAHKHIDYYKRLSST